MSNIIFYETPEGKVHIQVRFENETFWLTQKAMADLFGTSTQNITLHLKNIFDENELQLESTCKDFLQVQTEGKWQLEKSL